MRCEELKDLVPLHVVGLLDRDEEGKLREHLEGGCPRCVAELSATSAALAEMPYALPAEEPSPLAKARLMAAVRREAGTASPGASRRRTAISAVAAALAGALLAGGALERRHAAVMESLRSQITRQEQQLARQDQAMTALREEVRRAGETIRLVSTPGVVVVNLEGQGPGAGSAARIFWDRSQTSWQLYAANLQAPPPGRTYQLWLITGKRKISAGTFDPAAGPATGTVQVPPDAGPVVAAAVTDEPQGGSPQPTGSIHLLGKV